jgi:hypothetical protein
MTKELTLMNNRNKKLREKTFNKIYEDLDNLKSMTNEYSSILKLHQHTSSNIQPPVNSGYILMTVGKNDIHCSLRYNLDIIKTIELIAAITKLRDSLLKKNEPTFRLLAEMPEISDRMADIGFVLPAKKDDVNYVG